MKKLFLFFVITLSIFTQTFTGKVVGVSDGDTVTVLENKTQYKIRLNGIDAPESKQDFGSKSKQYLSDLIFGKTVTVEVQTIDQYKRYVSDIYLDGQYINAKMIEKGLAWHYKQYSKDQNLAELENEARTAKVGLWSSKEPTAPWDFRKGKTTTTTKTTNTVKKETSSKQNEQTVYIANSGSKYHRSSCSSLKKSKISISKSDAIAQGYEPCKKCNP